MKTIKKMLAVLLALVFAFSGLSCTFQNRDEEQRLDRSYPDDVVPIYEGALVYGYENQDDTEHEVLAGTKDSVGDVANYYSDYFYDEDINLTSESRNSSGYTAEGSYDGWTFEIMVYKPSSAKNQYKAMIEIYIKSSGGENGDAPIDIGSDKQVKEILELMQGDLQIINNLIEDSGTNDDMSLDEIITMFDEYIVQIENKILEIKQRQVTEIQLIRLQNSEIVLFEMLSDLLTEVKLVSYYAIDLTDIYIALAEDMEGLGSGSDYEIQQIINTSLTNAIESLKTVDVPTFLQFKHNKLVETMDEYSFFATYSIWAYSIEDHLRISSYNYFLDLYLRYFDKFALGIDADLTTRLSKYDEDIDYIKTWSEDLAYFINGALNSEILDLTLYKDEYLSLAENIMVSCTYAVPDDLIPANYRSMEYLAFIELWTNRGEADVMVTVEIPEYTQQYKQRITISSAETELAVLPPLVADINDKLNTSKDAYVEITVEDINTGEVILQASEPILLNSIYDMRWLGSDELDYYVDILAWVTPENDMVLQLQRHAADSVELISGGQINGIWGYQNPGGSFVESDVTYYQIAALMNAMADAMNVKYINSSFSTTDRTIQRISTPARVLENESGLCIETAVTLASALVASRMNAMIILLPTHAQVAVETWYNSGEYFLVETTALQSAKNQNFNYIVIDYLTKDEWQQYISQNNVVAIDCSMAGILDIYPIE